MDNKTTLNDGGPAFPTTPVSHGYSPDTSGYGTGSGPGMTLRDYFAAAALNALLQETIVGRIIPNSPDNKYSGLKEEVYTAIKAYEIADHMLKVRENEL